MISVYDFQDYREFLKTWIASQASAGRGQAGLLAKAAGVSSTMISLVLKGDKQLHLEQASDIADAIGLSEPEGDYFFLLVEYGRAGSFRLQAKLLKKIKASQQQAQKISHRVKKDRELSEETKSIFYSSWIYTGLMNRIAIPGQTDIQSLAKSLQLPAVVVGKVVDFLIQHDLCQWKNGSLAYGSARTHLGSDSPHVLKHHQNWRVRSFPEMEKFSESNLFFTSPMSLSVSDAEKIRSLLPKYIEEVMKIVGPSPSEETYCWNMDWFKY
jgi:uncharacterized protein (TIGR02147 family)